MTPEQFCYWMQGFAELSGDCQPTPEQWKSIRDHLQLVFKKVTPKLPVPLPNKQQLNYEEILKRQSFPGLEPPPQITC